MSSAICFNLNQSKILSSGNGLRYVTHQAKRDLMEIEKSIDSWSVSTPGQPAQSAQTDSGQLVWTAEAGLVLFFLQIQYNLYLETNKGK